MTTKWHIGQDIVSIKKQSNGYFNDGDVFVINGLRNSKCKCDEVEIDIGKFINYNSSQSCSRCGVHNIPVSEGILWFSEKSFAPLDTLL